MRIVRVLILILISSSLSSAQVWSWAKSAGGNGLSGGDRGNSICTDSRGNSYVTGIFQDSAIDFGNDTLVWQGWNPDAFIAKYNSTGDVLWARSIKNTTQWNGEGCESLGITVDKNGNIYFTGFYSDSVIFGNDTLTTNGNAYFFLAKYDSLGNEIWVKSGGNNRTTYGFAVTVDNSGNVIITGTFASDTLIIASDTIINHDSTGNFNDIFIAKYSSSGSLIWVISGGGSDNDQVEDVSSDKQDN